MRKIIKTTVDSWFDSLSCCFASYIFPDAQKNINNYTEEEEESLLPPANELDPSVLEGKRCLELLPLERCLALFEAPLATITFMDGDPSVATAYLTARVADILNRNPWLGGYFAKKKDGKVSLFYDENGIHVHPNIFTSYAPGLIPLTRETCYGDLGNIFAPHDVVVRCNADLVGRDLPLFRVSVIPDVELPQSRFALVASLSHVAGDGYIFNKLFKMLSTDAVPIALNPVRKPEFTDAVYDLCGPNEAFYVTKISRSPVWADYIPGQNIDDRVIVRAAFFIDEDWIEGQKEAWNKVAKMEEAQKLFGVNRNSQKASNEQHNAKIPDADKRGKSKSAFKVSYSSHQSAPHLTTNDIITSWFFKTTNATVGLLPYMMRGADRSETITENDAGNYAVAIPFAPEDYDTPMLIQQARQTGRRLNHHGADNNGTPLPSHERGNRYAVCVDWRNIGLRRGGLKLGLPPTSGGGENNHCTQVLHLPCYQARDLNFIPKSFSSIQLFNAGPHGEPACTVMTTEEHMQDILKSGIVKAMINESSTVEGKGGCEDIFEQSVQDAKQGRRMSNYANLTDQSELAKLIRIDLTSF